MENKTESKTGPAKINEIATLLGGLAASVRLQDGTTEDVMIRQLPINLLPKMLLCLDDEPAFVDLLCDKPDGWSLKLAMQDFETVVIEGEALNRDFFGRWLRRRLDRQERLVPGLMEKMTAAALPSLISSPKSPSNAG